jgi:hypothetical protein
LKACVPIKLGKNRELSKQYLQTEGGRTLTGRVTALAGKLGAFADLRVNRFGKPAMMGR